MFFDNVGGPQLEAAIGAMRDFGRIVACGSISRYNDTQPEPGPRNLAFVVTKRLRYQGFIILDHVIRAARAGLPYVYLGYWVEGSSRMAYKTGFQPLERLGRDGWRRMDEAAIGAEISEPLSLPTRRDRRRLLIDA